jgi:chemosensory pili system protein ChpA (sensor histidine kinase/response regulator)
MDSSLGNEIVTGFIEEVEGYLPDMNRCLQTLEQDRTHRTSLAELHRITHTIKGAAAMVGLDDLSAIGDILEKVMENLLGPALDLDDEITILLKDATRRIESYCAMQREGRPDDGHLFLQPIAEFEEKILKNIPDASESEGDSEENNPETLLFDIEEEEQNILSEAEKSEPDEFNELEKENHSDTLDDLFAEDADNASEGANNPENFFEDIFEKIPLATPQETSAPPEEDIFSGETRQKSQEVPEPTDIDPELLECFQEETEDHLENIDNCLSKLEKHITEPAALTPSTQEELHSLRRSVHTLKGAAAVIGIEQVAAWGHDFEDFLDWLHDEARQLDPAIVAALRDGSDLLTSLAENPGLPAQQDRQRIVTKFNTITEDFLSSPQRPAAQSRETEDLFAPAQDNAADFFSAIDKDASEEKETSDSFFDEFSSPTSSSMEEDEEEFLLQASEEEDLFDSINTGHAEIEDSVASDPIDPELLQCFQEETEDHLENIDSCLNSLEEQITDLIALTPSTQETLHSLRRSVHTLKGAAAVIGIEQVAAWGHDFEDFLDWLHDEAQQLDPSTMIALRDGADLLASLAETPDLAVAKDKQRITTLFKDITQIFSSRPVSTEAQEAETLLLVEEEPEETESFFDEFTSSSSMSEEERDDDLFGPADELPDDSEDLFAATNDSAPESDHNDALFEAIDPELLECFREETEEHLENIDHCLNQLTDQVSEPVELDTTNQEILHSLRRSVHTLKGAAAVIGIEQVAAWGHDFEDFLDWLHDEARQLTPSIISLLREGTDLLTELSENPASAVEKRKIHLTNQFNAVTADHTSPDHIEQAVPPLSEEEETTTLGGSCQEGVEHIDEELLQCFHEEAEEHLENIDRQVNHLNMTISEETELTDLRRGSLHSIRRSVHTLKGASAVIGIDQIAAWGHDFEDFLDWLHDEAQTINPGIIKAMQEGADLLVQLVENPNRSVHADQEAVQEKIEKIRAGEAEDNNESTTKASKEQQPTQEHTALSSEQIAEKKPQALPVQQRTKSATLRVDVNRVDQLVGLSGDMVINLSSFEDSMDTMSGTMKELDMILQRLKNINSSLEAGYELASIPHLGSSDDGQSSELSEDFDPLEMDRYSELNILIRSLTEAVSDLDSIMAQNALDNVTWQKTVERQNMVLKDLQNRMMGIRMTPFSTLSSRMQRTVREAARTTGHPARLTIVGESIMMDTRVWDVMADPLMHLLRNAVAHGGSLPGQENRGPLSITITARRKGGLCTLQVSDNGKGLDYEAIRIKGMKLYPHDRINLMSDRELADLIFRHGFSSTGTVTNIAGRGVGMDVVRDAVDQLNGSIELLSERGQGTEFTMRLPVAVAQLPAILARFGTQMYAVPMHDVESIVRATSEEKKGREYSFDGTNIPLLHPAEIPGFETGGAYTEENLTEDDQALLIVHAGRKRAAVLCEQLIGQRDIVFKELGSHLHNVPCISGVTIMGDGSLIPILHVEEVLRTWTSAGKQQDKGQQRRPVKTQTLLRVLVVDDSISVRKVVSNLITQQGWLPISARNGIEAMEKIREERPDIVLLDVEMPRMNGFEVLQALQAQPELRDIPVAMLTSRSAEKYQNKARELGARAFMNKPFKADEVISFIQKVTPAEHVESYS